MEQEIVIKSPNLETKEVVKNEIVLTESQNHCLDSVTDFIMDDGKMTFNLSGYSGVGKSTIVQFLIKAFPSRQFLACTPTHRANKVLSNMLSESGKAIEVKTIASLFGMRMNPVSRKHELNAANDKILCRDLILLADECGMIGSELFMNMVKVCFERNIKIIFIGDIAQIPPVKSDSVSPTFTNCDDNYLLTQLMRQNPSNPLVNIYTIIRNNMLCKHNFVTRLNEQGEGLEIIDNKGQFLGAIDELFKSDEFKTDKSFVKIICYRNTKVREYNDYVRQLTLEDKETQYQVGEILTGYTQIASSNLIENSEDYVILENKGIIDHSFYAKTIKWSAPKVDLTATSNRSHPDTQSSLESKKFTLKAYSLTIKPITSTSRYGIKIYIPLLEEETNQPFFQNLYELSQQQAFEKNKNKKTELYKALVDIFSNIQLNEALFLYDEKCTSLTKIKRDNPQLFINDNFGFSEFDRIMDSHKGFVLEKNIDYGYAVSCHKVQGGTFTFCLVDIKDLSHPANNIIIYKGEEKYSLLMNNLIYVALSRCKVKTIALQ